MIVEAVSLFLLDLLAIFAIYLILNLGLNIEYGFTGIPNFGTVFWVAAGAFTVGALSTNLAAWMLGINISGLNIITDNIIIVTKVNEYIAAQPLYGIILLIIMLIMAASVGAVLGIILSLPTVRLKADYLAITFLAFGEILNVIGTAYEPLVGGPPGVNVPDVWAWAGGWRFVASTLTIAIIAIIIFIYSEYLIKTPFGRVLRSIRDNEVAAAALGKDIARYKLTAMIIGSIMISVAGALFVLYSGSVTPTFFRFYWTFLPWLMILLGGVGNSLGVAAGTAMFYTVYKLIIYYKYVLMGFMPFDVVWLNYILLGIVVVLVLIFRPQGLIPEKPKRYKT
ncbi:MAG: branched-chain amino acid ABC transporter permease [Thermoprotei archaeon]